MVKFPYKPIKFCKSIGTSYKTLKLPLSSISLTLNNFKHVSFYFFFSGAGRLDVLMPCLLLWFLKFGTGLDPRGISELHAALPLLLLIDMYGFPTMDALNEIWFEDVTGPKLIVDVEVFCWFSTAITINSLTIGSINLPSTGQRTWKIPVLSLHFICMHVSLTLNNWDNSVTLT